MNPNSEHIAVGDAGSATLKFSLLKGEETVLTALIDRLGTAAAKAAEAVEYFCYRIARELGSMAAALGGLDALVFTGGIDEHAAPVRARICELSGWLGIAIDPEANDHSRTVLHRDDSRVRVLVVPTHEERMVARHVRQVLEVPSGSA